MADATERAEIGEVPADGALAPAAPTAAAPSSSGFAAKAKDLQALRDAVVDAAGVGAGLWVSFLFVFFYLAIAAGGVSHRDMFFENPVKLPFLNVDLPLIGFFVLGPLLFLIVHAYTLLHFVMLAGKVGAFHAELQDQIPDEDARARLRRQLPSNIFVQFLAGPREIRTGAMGFMLRLIAQISLVAGPIALLVFFQLQFLPYHDARRGRRPYPPVGFMAFSCERHRDLSRLARLPLRQGRRVPAGECGAGAAGVHRRHLPRRMAGGTPSAAAVGSDRMGACQMGFAARIAGRGQGQ
jgi:hypothetical protein